MKNLTSQLPEQPNTIPVEDTDALIEKIGYGMC